MMTQIKFYSNGIFYTTTSTSATTASKPRKELKKNVWFDGVFDTMEPLTYDNKEFCTISRELNDLQPNNLRQDIYEDKTAEFLKPFTRRLPPTNNSNSSSTSSSSSSSSSYYYYFGGITSQKFGFPCRYEDVLVAYGKNPLDWSEPTNWKYLVAHDESKNVGKDDMFRDTSQVWYSCGADNTAKTGRIKDRMVTFGTNPTKALQQIEVSRKFYSQMNYDHDKTPKGQRPPDIFTFVIDSTSRSNFHRQMVPFIEMLRNNNRWSKNLDTYEMFRYSSLGWGTGCNMQILTQGCGIYPGRPNPNMPQIECSEQNIPIHLWLAASGYVLLGNYTYQKDMPYQFGEIFGGDTALQTQYIRGYKRTHLDLFVDYALDQSNFYSQHGPDLPQYFMAHVDDNHGSGTGMNGQASSLIRLLDGLDFDNRNIIFMIMADHGIYKSSDPLLDIEKSNPLLLTLTSQGALSPSQTQIWKTNQQRLTTHWDVHATLKGLPLQYSSSKTNKWPNVEEYCQLDGQNGASTCGPHNLWNTSKSISSDKDRSGRTLPSIQTNLMLSVIPTNRTCTDAGSEGNFCVCGGVANDGHVWNQTESHWIVHNTVNELNMWTGNGTLDCQLYDEKEFVISKTLSYSEESSLRGHHILTINPKFSNVSFSVTIKPTLEVLYFTNKYKLHAPNILRQDKFDAEQCLITYPDGRMPIFKSNATAGNNLMLRWCHCKSF